jgi:hypothetical protein
MSVFSLLRCDTPECQEPVQQIGQCVRCRRDAEEAREAGLGELLDKHVWENCLAVSPSGVSLSVESHEKMKLYSRPRSTRQAVPSPEPLTRQQLSKQTPMTQNTAAPLAAYVAAAKARARASLQEVA